MRESIEFNIDESYDIPLVLLQSLRASDHGLTLILMVTLITPHQRLKSLGDADESSGGSCFCPK